MNLNAFKGNTGIKESLLGAIASGRLSHGLLICGEKGMGVNYFAHLLAADIVGADDTDALAAGKNPLVQIVRGEGASGLIRVDKIRQVNENVAFSSISGEKRVVIIENCENFNPNSANALLKNLEEPKNDTTYILTTNNPRAILATIRSRCGIFTLANPAKQEVIDYFSRTESDMRTVQSLMDIYGESIGKIKSALESENRYSILQDAVKIFGLASLKDGYRVSKLCYPYTKRKDEFRLLLEDLRDICCRSLSFKTIDMIDTIQKYTEILNTNANLNLAAENFSVEISK